MRKHQINCQIENMNEYVLKEIQCEINNTYVKLLANIIRKSYLTKKEQIGVICKIQDKLKN